MHSPEFQPHLEGLSKRNVLEGQPPEVLVQLKGQILSRISYDEADVHLINDVLDGMGYSRVGDEAVYDANDGTIGHPEHWNDSRWAVETIPKNIELGRE